MPPKNKPPQSGAAGGSASTPSPSAVPVEPITSSGGGGNVAGFLLTPQPYDLVMPGEETRYVVTDSQLELLSSGGKDVSLEWSLFAAGAALGCLQNFLSVVLALYTGSNPGPKAYEYIGPAIFVGLTVFAITKFVEYRGKRANTETLKTKIKTGQKYLVGSK